MPELSRIRDEGLIKGSGFGVNTIEPILKALEVSDPDIFLAAKHDSLMKYENSINRLFPAYEEHGASIVVGAPLNAGFLAGLDRYDYRRTIPAGFKETRAEMMEIAERHGTDLRTAAPSIDRRAVRGLDDNSSSPERGPSRGECRIHEGSHPRRLLDRA